jgi:HK97 family phage prohead protease
MESTNKFNVTGGDVHFVRSADNAKEKISGYAIEYYDGSEKTEYKRGKIAERVKPGTFRQYIRSGEPIAVLFNHDEGMELGRSDYPDCSVTEDGRGVKVEIDYDPTDPLHQLVRSKANKPGSRLGWSFNAEGRHDFDKEGNRYVRTIHTINKVTDLSVVMRPAYEATTVYIRSEDETAIAKLEKKLAIIEYAKSLATAIDK